MYRESIEEFKAASSLDTNPAYLAGLARSYALNRQPADAQRVLTQVMSLPAPQAANPYQIALVYLAMGDHNHALDWLERARNEHSWLLIYLRVDPRIDPLRSEPRYSELVRQIHFSS